MKKAIMTATVLLLAGCTIRPPETRFKVDLNKGTCELNSSHDRDLSGLTVIKSGTNVTIKIDKYASKMNPDVVTATALGQEALLRTGMDGAGDISAKLLKAAIEAYIASNGVPPRK